MTLPADIWSLDPVSLEAILAAPRLAKAFKRELCGEHKELFVEPAPKKRGAK